MAATKARLSYRTIKPHGGTYFVARRATDAQPFYYSPIYGSAIAAKQAADEWRTKQCPSVAQS